MSLSHRIVVVENLEGLRTQYIIGLEMAGFEANGAASLQEALDLIKIKTFHVALVDLMLNDPHDTTMQGLEVLEKLCALNEGTQAIVISGQDSPGIAVDAITEYQAAKYIPKSKILNEGMDFLINEVSHLAEATELRKYGDGDSIISVLAGATEQLVWTDSFLRTLKPKNGFTGLKNFFTQFCEPVVPLMSPQEASSPLLFDKEQRFANGRFWSKGLGLPLELVVCRADEAAELLYQENYTAWHNDPIVEYKSCGLKGYAFGLPDDVARSEFVEKI